MGKQVKNSGGNPPVQKSSLGKFFEEAEKDPLIGLKKGQALKEELAKEGFRDTTGMAFSGSGTSGIIPKQYRKLENKLGYSTATMTEADANKKAYLNQTTGEVIKNGILGFGVNFASGVMDHIGGYDAVDIGNMALGNAEEEFGNWATDTANRLRDYTQEEFSIFQDPASADSLLKGMSTLAFWTNMAQQSGNTVGQIASIFGEQALLSLVTSGSGGLGSGLQATRLTQSLAGLARGGVRTSALKGMARGIQEGYINGLETQRAVEQKYKNLGYSDEDAKRLGAEAAAIGFRTEVLPLMALNALQFSTIKKANPFGQAQGADMGMSGLVESAFEKALPKINSKWGRGVTGYGINMASEAVEEGYQAGVQGYAEYALDKKYNTIGTKTMGDYLWTREMAESMIAGGFMGGVFKGVGDLMSRTQKNTTAKIYNEDLSKFMEGTKQLVEDNVTQLAQAYASGDRGELSMALYKNNTNNVLAAITHDVMAQKETGFETYVGELEKINTLVQQGNMEELAKFGITNEEDLNHIKQNYPKFIQQAHNIRNNFISNAENSIDLYSAEKITIEQANYNNLVEVEKDVKNSLENSFKNNPQFNQLSVQGQDRFRKQSELKALNSFSEEFLTPEMKTRKAELTEELDSINSEQALTNEDVLFNTINSDKFIKDYIDLVAINKNKYSSAQEIGLWNDTNYQQKKARERVENIITQQLNTASDVKDLKKLKEQSKNNKFVNKQLLDKIDAKIAEVETKSTTSSMKTQPSTEGKTQSTAKEKEMLQGSQTSEEGRQKLNKTFEKTSNIPQVKEGTEKIISTAEELERYMDEVRRGVAKENKPETNVDGTPVAEATHFLNIDSSDKLDALKEQVKLMYDVLSFDMNKKISFEDLVRYLVMAKGKERVAPVYNSLVEGWKANGYPLSDVNSTRNAIFNDMTAVVDNFLNNPNFISEVPTHNNQDLGSQTEEQNLNLLNKNVEDLNQKDLQSIPKNKITSPYQIGSDLIVTNSNEVVDGELRAAYLSVKYTTDENGNRRTIEDPTLVDTTDVQSHLLLRQDVANVDDILDVRVADNPENITINTWNADGSQGEPMKFGDWVNKNNIEVGSPEYISMLPIIAYQDNTPLFFIHTPQWYNPSNSGFKDDLEAQAKVIKEGRATSMALRNSIYNNKGGQIRITFKGLGHIVKLNDNQPLVSNYSQDPDARVGFIWSGGNYVLSDGTVESSDSNRLVHPNRRYRLGQTVVLRKGNVRGVEVPLATTKSLIPQERVNTLVEILRAYMFQHNEANRNQALRDSYLQATGLDIFDKVDIEKIFKMYVGSALVTDKTRNVDVDALMNNKTTFRNDENTGKDAEVLLEDGTPYFYFQNFNLYYGGVREIQSGTTSQTVLRRIPFADTQFTPEFIQGIEDDLQRLSTLFSRTTVGATKEGFDLDTAGKKFPNVANGKLVESNESYREFLLKNLNTNVKAFNVGTDANPYYATFVQPVIKFEHIGVGTSINVENQDTVIPTEQVYNQDPVPNTEWQMFKDGNTVSNETVETIATKVEQGQELSVREEEIYVAKAQEVTESILDKERPSDIATEITLEDLKTTYKHFKKLGLEDSSLAVQMVLTKIQGYNQDSNLQFNIDVDSTVSLFNNEEFINNVLSQSSKIEGVTNKEIQHIATHIFNLVSSKIGLNKGDSITGKEVKALLDEVNRNFVQDIIKENNTLESMYSSLLAQDPDNISLMAITEALQENIKKVKNISDNWNIILREAEDTIKKYTNITFKPGIFESMSDVEVLEDTQTDEAFDDSMDSAMNDNNEQDKNFSKMSLEENGKQTTSPRLRRFLNSIQNVTKENQNTVGFLGVPDYIGFDTAFETIQKVLSTPYEIESNYQDIIQRLEENVEAYPWMRQVVDKLEASDLQIKNELTYNMAKHTLSMKFMMFSKDRSGKVSMKVYNTNSNEITYVIRERWNNNFLSGSPLVKVLMDGGLPTYRIDKKVAKALYDELKSFDLETVTNKQLQDWLFNFGIYLSNETLNELRDKSLIIYSDNGAKLKINFADQFAISNNSLGLFGQLGKYLQNMTYMNDEATNFEENKKAHPFGDINNVLKTIINIESKYSMFSTTNSFRDGTKSIFGFTPTKFATDSSHKLRMEDDSYRQSLLEKPFQKQSFLLNSLNTDPNLRGKFYVDHLGITALKEYGQKVFGDNNEITNLGSVDLNYTKLGLFQDLEQGDSKVTVGNNKLFSTRMGRLFFPTMSDKSQMLLLNSLLLNLTDKHIVIDKDNNFSFSNESLDFFISQLVEPELNRITDYYSRDVKTNIKGYDAVAGMFLQYPELNNLEIELDGETHRVIKLMANDPQIYNKEWFMGNMLNKTREYINLHFMNEVNKELNSWRANGYIDVSNNNLLLDKNYMNKFEGDSSKKAKMAAMEYVMNQQINQAQIQMLFIGDMALYSNIKPKNFFKDGKVFLPKDGENDYGDAVYSHIAKNVIGTNLGKRLALLLAPGSKLANSRDSKYLQVFLNDFESMATNAKSLIKLFYGSEKLKEHNSIIDEYFSKGQNTDDERKKDIVDILSADMPEIAEYFAIEATDAQEYTTLKEHLNVLFGQGRLSESLYDSLMAKANTQISKEEKGQELLPEDMFTKQELKAVVQPIKPVHTGFYNDVDNNVMRMMYIKSSSFPLIPQLTKGLEIDKLRLMAEKLERVTNKPVRLSYQSANKVGANTNAITPFDSSGNFNSAIIEDLDNIKDEASFFSSNLFHSTMTLDRDNFRIQQDVPFKSDKRKEDTISLGTQTLKLLFGDGVRDIDGFIYKGESYNGKQLQAIYEENFVKYINHKKEMLYKELELDVNGQPSSLSAVKKIQNLLQREAIERGYSQQDIDALELETIDGNTSFAMPLWMSPNSGRYESLLNAIVSNRLAHIKMPGSSFVAGSEAGFKVNNNLEGVNQSRIIYTDKWQGELKSSGSVDTPNGKKLLKFQVLMPSKFRGKNGKLLEFFDKDGKPNTKYINIKEDGSLSIKKEMFDAELFSMTSFRIPTSSHVSMSQIEVAGFLPPENGDLLIVPKNLTKQKGLDFDIDKENVYSLWTYITDKGKFKALKEEDIETLVQKAKDIKADRNLVNTDEEAQGLVDLIGEEVNWDDVEIPEDKFIQNLRDRLTQKALENAFVRVHSSVLSNPSDAMQQKISKVLSMDFARSQADFIGGLVNTAENNDYFSVFNSDYQNSKMGLGSAGKMGIGVYSNYVVLHSMIQQINSPEVQIIDLDKNPVEFTLGGIKSDGRLGKVNTLDGNRTIAEVLAERQNTATDNEKEQIMGRLNINKHTINVDSFLTLLGFDKVNADVDGQNKEISLSYAFLSQPIIKEYVEMMDNINSNVNPVFTADADEVVTNTLLEKRGVDTNVEIDDSILTGTNLIAELTNPSDKFQGEVLRKFKELKTYADKFRTIQTPLSISRTGLGISMFETVEKYNNIDTLKKLSNFVTNIDKIVGDFKSTENMSIPSINDFVGKGYRYFADKQLLIKPLTPTGAMYIDTIKSGYDIWSRYFPYDSPALADTFQFIKELSGNDDVSSTKSVEIKQQIFKDAKKMLFSSQRLGLFRGEAQDVRAKLFIDVEGSNQSLASYLNELSNMRENSIVKKVILDNPLLSRFSYSINKSGLASVIKFDASRGENFDESKTYKAMTDLLEQNVVLPLTKNGEEYTTRNLVEDLIAYSYLEGGIQEAVQFNKYIPVSILKNLPFNRVVKSWETIPNFMRMALGSVYNKDGKKSVSNFVRQYFQHNPSKAPKINLNKNPLKSFILDYKGETLQNLNNFKVNTSKLPHIKDKEFFSIYDPTISKGLNKYHLFQRSNPFTNEYVRIDTLGMFGMSEYVAVPNNEANYVSSILGKPYIPQIKVEQELPQQSSSSVVDNKESNVYKEGQPDLYNIADSTSLKTVLKNIYTKGVQAQPELTKLAEYLVDNMPKDTTIKVEDNTNNVSAVASFNPDNNQISIFRDALVSKEPSVTAKNVLHEAIHYLTSDYLKQYVDNDGNYLVDTIPSEVQTLVSLFSLARRDVGISRVLELKNKLANSNANEGKILFNSEEARIIYGLTSVHEFVTLVLTEPDFQQRMNEVHVDADKKVTMWERFTDIISNIIGKIFGEKFNKNGVTYNAIATSLSIIENNRSMQEQTLSMIAQAQQADRNKAIQARQNEEATKNSMLSSELPQDTVGQGLNNTAQETEITFNDAKSFAEYMAKVHAENAKKLNIDSIEFDLNQKDLESLPTC